MTRFLKFGVVGIINTLITLAVFNIAAVLLHLPAVAANALGWLAGFTNSFILNRRWTFADRTGVRGTRSLGRFAAAGLVALGLSTGVIAGLQAIVRITGIGSTLPASVSLNIIELIAIAISLGANYTLATLWAFREEPGDNSDAGR